jgi:hypothetical protein
MKTHLLPRLLPEWTIVIVASLLLGSLQTTGSAQAAGRGKPQPNDPPPAAPLPRHWHSFTDNGSDNIESSRLFMFGGDGADTESLADFWYFSVASQQWVLAPTGKSKPGKRKHAVLSCGDGECIAATGASGRTLLRDTWIYAEQQGSWSQVNCRRSPCPPARMMAAMAYDPGRLYHVLFGGFGTLGNLDDTWSFAGGAWVREATPGPVDPAEKPAARRSAAMTYVSSPVNRIVLHGGQTPGAGTLCDLWSWDGDNWLPVTASGPVSPCLHSHNIAWDGAQLMVTGGYVDTSDTANSLTWYFKFDDAGSGTWSIGSDPTSCYSSVKPDARMAHDKATGSNVFFGGSDNGPNGVIVYGDTTICD